MAADVCRALELEDVNKAISRLDEDEGKASISRNNFYNSYSKAAYIFGILKRYTAETVVGKNDFDSREMY